MGGAPYSIDPGLGGPTGPGTGIPTASSTRPLFDYGGEVPQEMAIPDDPNTRTLPMAPPLQQQQSGLGDIVSLIGDAAKAYGAYAAIAAAKRGGRIKKADAGEVSGDDVLPEIDVDAQRPDPDVQYTGGVNPVDRADAGADSR